MYYLSKSARYRAHNILKNGIRHHTHGAAVIGTIDGLDKQEFTMRQLLVRIKPYVWPDKNETGGREVRSKVVKTGSLIATAKGISVVTPWFYKQFIDSLAGMNPSSEMDLRRHCNSIQFFSYSKHWTTGNCCSFCASISSLGKFTFA